MLFEMESPEIYRRHSLRKRVLLLNTRPTNTELWSHQRRLKIVQGFPGLHLAESELTEFLRLLTTDPVIKAFLLQDRCNRMCDKYLIVMALVYFKKSGLSKDNYNRYNFFAALYLAHDMFEDNDAAKWDLLPWALGRRWKTNLKAFIRTKNEMWQRMNFNAVVSRKCCEQIFSMPAAANHPVFKRTRSSDHGDVCHRKRDSLTKSFSPLYSPQGPLWSKFVLTKTRPESWPKILASEVVSCCPVCNLNPVDVWNQSGDWALFDAAKTFQMRQELDWKENVLLEPGLDLTVDDDVDEEALRIIVQLPEKNQSLMCYDVNATKADQAARNTSNVNSKDSDVDMVPHDRQCDNVIVGNVGDRAKSEVDSSVTSAQQRKRGAVAIENGGGEEVVRKRRSESTSVQRREIVSRAFGDHCPSVTAGGDARGQLVNVFNVCDLKRSKDLSQDLLIDLLIS